MFAVYLLAALGALVLAMLIYLTIESDVSDYLAQRRHKSKEARVMRLKKKAEKWGLDSESRYMDLLIDYMYDEKII